MLLSLHCLLENLLHDPDNLSMAMPLPGVIDVINLIHKLFVGSSVFLFCVYIALSATGS